MVIAPMLDTQGLSLEVPDYVEAKSIAKDTKVLNVLVNNENQIVIDGEVVEESQLQNKLKSLANNYKDGILFKPKMMQHMVLL
ncbi:MAG: biopolymer transporter ExbD [Candidatus Melainabacteria bacterium]|nr:MAG: biopolymer transporter ExbD [Candidatus Melainabacteria bacterium]